MIISFSVENFRSIRKRVCLDFRASSDKHLEESLVVEIEKPKLRLMKMAMIYGANASGKTNILMALDFLQKLVISPLQDKNEDMRVPAFALDKDQASSFEIEFYYDEICYSYYVKLNNKMILEEALDHYPKGYKANVFRRQYDENQKRHEYKWTDKSYGKILREKLQLAIPNQSILSAISSVNDEGSIQKAHDWFRFHLMSLLGPKHSLTNLVYDVFPTNEVNKEFYLHLLKKADFQIGDFNFEKRVIPIDQVPESVRTHFSRDKEDLDPNLKLQQVKFDLEHIIQEGSFKLQLREESMGTQRFLGLGVFLEMMTKGNICIPIDELDCSLHIDLIELFILLFFKYSVASQLIFTSYNVALLNKKNIIRRDVIWITDRLSDGSTQLSRVDEYPVRKEHAIDKLFMKGQIGGKPDIGVI